MPTRYQFRYSDDIDYNLVFKCRERREFAIRIIEIEMIVTVASYTLLTAAVGFLVTWLVIEWFERAARRKAVQQNVKYVRSPSQMFSIARKQRFDLMEKKMMEENDRLIACSQFGQFTVVTTEPELVQTVFNKEFTKFANRRVGSDGRRYDPINSKLSSSRSSPPIPCSKTSSLLQRMIRGKDLDQL